MSYSRAEFETHRRCGPSGSASRCTDSFQSGTAGALPCREVADPDRRLELLDFVVDRHGDVPRNDCKYRRAPTSGLGATGPIRRGRRDHQLAHLNGHEATAAAALLAVMTGENISVILDTPAAHHRSDRHTGEAATAILDTCKPRRGKRAYMNRALSQVPDWISIPKQPELLSSRRAAHPFGVYALIRS